MRRLEAWLPALAALALAACGVPRLTSTLPGTAAPVSYVGAQAGVLAPDAVEPELKALEDALGDLGGWHAPVPLKLSREGESLKLRFGEAESFAAGSAELKPAALAAYAGLARVLAARGGTVAHIRVLGDVAPEPSIGLAARRAASVQAYLAARGVPGTRLRAEGRESAPSGAAVEVLLKPIVAGREAEAWAPPA